ncbi:Rv3654c family TadE-like protein [Clavibacter michiganensis]|uniref:Rv3654c family TadE-like protein n=1 Tax=Clavibacter michiganensis TaxID=28447 RepID=UPI001BE036DE|nr:Rv3654c family TadE-like protein [Clavibacter michiganensis]MBT1636230.1 flp pilus-assembly TadE/G-like family protein [Clavibacter michiganensis]
MGRDDDSGSGSVLAVGLIGAVAALGFATMSVSALLVDRAVAAGAADSAALAAADAAAGYVSGAPCDAAEELMAPVGTELVGCAVDGTTADVRVRVPGTPFGVPITARARAGQPDERIAGARDPDP